MNDGVVTLQVRIKDHAVPTWLVREILQLYGVRSVVKLEYDNAGGFDPDESTRITRPGGQR